MSNTSGTNASGSASFSRMFIATGMHLNASVFECQHGHPPALREETNHPDIRIPVPETDISPDCALQRLPIEIMDGLLVSGR